MQGFSFIVCTHNPDQTMFRDVVTNLLSIMKHSNAESELIIVDNNSTPQLQHDDFLNEIVINYKNVYIIQENKPGLTFARIAGYQKSKYDWLIFVDDDNLPSQNYLVELSRIIELHPKVRCWGAGKIEVIYVNQKESKYLDYLKPLFQAREIKGVNYSNNRNGEEFYPPGSSMCVSKQLMTTYFNLIESKKVTSTDRIGKSLNSAGDAQIVYCCIKEGFYAGSSGELALQHLISNKKTKFSYLMNLKYSLNSCQVKAYNEVFYDSPILVKSNSNSQILKSIYFNVRVKSKLGFKITLLHIAEVMGMYNASCLAGGFHKPALLRLFEKLINHR